MKVLVVTIVHDPEDARIRHRQIPTLLAAGHQITLAASYTDHHRPIPSDIGAIDVPRAQGRRRLSAIRHARRMLKHEGRRFDLVLLHDPELLPATAGLDLPGLIWDVHEDTAAALAMKPWLPSYARVPAAMAIRMVERQAERRMTLILAEEAYNDRFSDEHTVIRNTIPVPERVSTVGDDRVIYVGRLTRPRGARELIELGRRLAPDLTVHLIGPADHDCTELLKDAHRAGEVFWHGFLPNADALAHLDGALAGVSLLHDQPNYSHSRPTKLVEYMAYGLPMVTTPNAASARLVSQHECGIVVPFGDVAAAEKAVRRLAADPAERNRLAGAGRSAALAQYNWSTDADLFVRTLEKVASQSSS